MRMNFCSLVHYRILASFKVYLELLENLFLYNIRKIYFPPIIGVATKQSPKQCITVRNFMEAYWYNTGLKRFERIFTNYSIVEILDFVIFGSMSFWTFWSKFCYKFSNFFECFPTVQDFYSITDEIEMFWKYFQPLFCLVILRKLCCILVHASVNELQTGCTYLLQYWSSSPSNKLWT